MLILDSDFRKQGEGERLIIVFIMFCGFGFKAAVWQEDDSACPDSGDSILEQCNAELWLVALILTLGSG